MPRLIRRAPLSERIKAYLDPYDLLLWLAEELNDDTYDEWLNDWATPIGLALNVVFVLARGASQAGGASTTRGRRDDVFGDDGKTGSGWFAWFAVFFVHTLTLFCCANALYTFLRKRHYRLFEQPIDEAPATPSAHRVPVDSSPISASPLRYLSTMLSPSAFSRAHPDPSRDVWELGVWDPKPFHLTLFTLFSPGHIFLYFTLLPPTALDPRPSVTILQTLAFATLLTVQLRLLATNFRQQAKDSTLLHGEVMNEYDTKFVRPLLQRPVRDVGIQTPPGGDDHSRPSSRHRNRSTREVDIYTPTTLINRGFRTNPNPNYADQYSPQTPPTMLQLPDNSATSSRRNSSTPNFHTPSNTAIYPSTNGSTQTPSFSLPAKNTSSFASSPLKPYHENLRERTPRRGDGGSLGVYSHAASPLRKAASSSHLEPRGSGGGGGGGREKGGSPLKRMSTPGGGGRY